MTSYSELFSDDLIVLGAEQKNSKDLFEFIAKKLNRLGYVTDKYQENLKNREEEFPTGLITSSMNIALPHTDPDVIKKPFVLICRTMNPIEFKQMGDCRFMNTNNLFFLGITNPSEQVGLLQSFMNLFMNESFVDEFRSLDKKREVIKLFKSNI